MELCGILYSYGEFYDRHGCLKKDCHYDDHHVFKAPDGRLIAWKHDGDCNCGCWDEWEFRDEEICVLYREVKSIDEEF